MGVVSVLVRDLVWILLTGKYCLVVNQAHNTKLIGDT